MSDVVSETDDSDARSETPPARRSRFLVFMKWVTILYVLGIVVFFGSAIYRFKRHRNLSDRMETAITRLAMHHPHDLTEDQWAYCIAWTWNLHVNYGGHPDYIPTDELERIVEEFEAKIDNGPNLATIDWLWDEYYRAYPRAHNYETWRPTSPANRSQFETGDHGGNPLAEWRSRYEERVR